MTRDTNDAQDRSAATTAGNDAIAAAAQTQLSLVASFERWLARKADGRPPNGILSRVQKRLEAYRRWLLEPEQAPGVLSEQVDSWDMDARVQPGSDDGPVITVTGPGLGEPIEIAAKDEKELRHLMSVCRQYHQKTCSATDSGCPVQDNYLGYMIKTVCTPTPLPS
jgi:hypothetical protein